MCTRAEFLGAILEFCIPYKLFKNSLKMFIIFFLMDAFCSYDAEKKKLTKCLINSSQSFLTLVSCMVEWLPKLVSSIS